MMILNYRLGADVGNSSTKSIIRLMDENTKPKAMKQKNACFTKHNNTFSNRG